MALLEGAKLFGVRRSMSPGTPLCKPYAKAAADTTAIKGGHPVVLASGTSGGNTVQRATISGTVITNTKVLGFAAADDYGTTSTDYGAFGMAINKSFLPNQNGMPTAVEMINVFVDDGDSTFQMAVDSGITVSEQLVGLTAGFKLGTSPDQIVLDTASSNKIAVITAIHPADNGKAGGRVDFVLISTARQYPQP